MHLPVMVNVSFQRAQAYGFEMVDAGFYRPTTRRFRQWKIYVMRNDSNFTQI